MTSMDKLKIIAERMAVLKPNITFICDTLGDNVNHATHDIIKNFARRIHAFFI